MTPPPINRALDASFDELAASVPATIGVAIAVPDETYSLGNWSTGVAWSTIKVPLAIAALRNDPSRAHDLVVKAIIESDNPASESIWSQLGEPAEAALQVQAVIHECGDFETVVESSRLRTGFTPFGQTRWSLTNQAQFAAHLAGIADAAIVVDLMSRLVDDHCWGLAAKGVAAKGGWGPGEQGGYLVRQFGILPKEFGPTGVALAADAKSLESGIDVLDAMTDWLFDTGWGLPPL